MIRNRRIDYPDGGRAYFMVRPMPDGSTRRYALHLSAVEIQRSTPAMIAKRVWAARAALAEFMKEPKWKRY